MQIKIHCDGGARGNPGPAASAFVVLDENGQVVHKHGEYIGDTTNNQAEYTAVIMALTWIIASEYNNPSNNITFILDSELVVKQLQGLYKVKDQNLKLRKNEIDDLLKNLNVQSITFTNVPRLLNAVADELVNTTLDAR